MRHLREIFDDWLTRGAGIVFVLIIVLVVVNTYTNLAQQHPLLGVFAFAFVPILFVLGGIFFILALWRLSR